MNRHPASTPAPGVCRYQVRVYYEDTDTGGVVYHANYLRMAERARTEALRDLGIAHADLIAEHDLFFMVRRVKVDYAAPARLDDRLVVATRPIALGAASVELRQSFFRVGADEADAANADWANNKVANRPLVVADVLLVCVSRVGDAPDALRPARIPDRWHAALSRLATENEGLGS